MGVPLTQEYFEEYMDSFAKMVKEGFDATASKEGVKAGLDDLQQRATRIEASMVTKVYLDEKLGELKGDLIAKLRKEDEKLNFIIALLRSRSIISEDDLKRIRSEFQIFPTMA